MRSSSTSARTASRRSRWTCDALLEQPDLLAVDVEALLLFEHPLLGDGALLEGGLQLLLGAVDGGFELGAPGDQPLGLLLPGADLAAAGFDLLGQAVHLAVLGFEALVEQLQPAAPAGARGPQALAGRLGRLGSAWARSKSSWRPAWWAVGGGELRLQVPLPFGDAGDLAEDLLLLGGEGLLLGGEPAVAGGGVLLAGLGDGALLAELADLALEAVGVARQTGALGDQTLEQGTGLLEVGFELRGLAVPRAASSRSRSRTPGVGDLALDMEGAGLDPDSVARSGRPLRDGAGPAGRRPRPYGRGNRAGGRWRGPAAGRGPRRG